MLYILLKGSNINLSMTCIYIYNAGEKKDIEISDARLHLINLAAILQTEEFQNDK